MIVIRDRGGRGRTQLGFQVPARSIEGLEKGDDARN